MRTHGHSGNRNPSPTYLSWQTMKARCGNPNNPKYKYYGGRGIRVCERWLNSFKDFLEDMGVRPEGKSLDRFPDNNGNYEPGNCRWASISEQRANQRPQKEPRGSYYRGGKRKRHWHASLWRDGKLIFLGAFYTEEEAHNAYVEAKRKEFPV
jgi:hypothetical protein